MIFNKLANDQWSTTNFNFLQLTFPVESLIDNTVVSFVIIMQEFVDEADGRLNQDQDQEYNTTTLIATEAASERMKNDISLWELLW